MIHIENLSKTYATPHGLFQALRGINHIEQGEVFGIMVPAALARARWSSASICWSGRMRARSPSAASR